MELISLLKENIYSSGVQLTVEQLKQIEQKRQEALKRRFDRNELMPIGESWRKHIGSEFTKPYFTKVQIQQTFYIQSHCTGMSHSFKADVKPLLLFSLCLLSLKRGNISLSIRVKRKSSYGQTCVHSKL